MKRFDLTFKGDILPDFDPDNVRADFAALFSINDPMVMDALFSGDSYVLRSNLDRKAAADYFRKIAQVGGRAELITRELSEQQAQHQVIAGDIFTLAPESDDANASGPQSSQRHIDYHEPANETVATSENAAPSTAEVAATGPSANEVLQRLTRLQRDAEVAHQSKLEQLQALQTEVKEETSNALEKIKQRREQTLIESQDEFTRLQEQASSAQAQHDSDISRLTEQEKAQSQQLKTELKGLEKQTIASREEVATSIEQIETDRENCTREAASAIAELEAQIASIRQQCESRVNELEQLLLQANADVHNLENASKEEAQSLQRAHQSELENLSLQKQELTRKHDAELEKVVQSRIRHERQREEKLTELWEDEEKNQHKAQERLKQIEVTRKRHQLAWEQRLERLQEEEDKIRKGELSLP